MKKSMQLMAFLLGVVLLTGCGQKGGTSSASESAAPTSSAETSAVASTEGQESSAKKGDKSANKDAASLSDWQEIHPTWVSITSFYKEGYLKEAAEKVAKEKKTTVDALLKEHEEGAHTDIASFTFDGNKLILKDAAGKELVSSEYKYVKTIGKGVEHGEFAIFEAVDKVPEQFKAFALMEPHGGEGDITHFHARYGKSVDDPALTDKKWWPVYVDPKSTQEQVVKEILANED